MIKQPGILKSLLFQWTLVVLIDSNFGTFVGNSSGEGRIIFKLISIKKNNNEHCFDLSGLISTNGVTDIKLKAI